VILVPERPATSAAKPSCSCSTKEACRRGHPHAGNARDTEAAHVTGAQPARGDLRPAALVAAGYARQAGPPTDTWHASWTPALTYAEWRRARRSLAATDRSKTMRLTIFAATGGIGRHLLEQSPRRGPRRHRRGPQPEGSTGGGAPRCRRLAARTRWRSQPRSTALTPSVGLGPRNPRSEAGIASRGTRAIVAAMQATHVRRIVVSAPRRRTVPSSGRPNPPKHDPGDGSYAASGRPLTSAVFAPHYADSR